MDGALYIEVEAPHRRQNKDETAMPRSESCFPEAHYIVASNEDVINLILTAAESAEFVR